MDITKFFDHVKHDILMNRIAQTIRDKRVRRSSWLNKQSSDPRGELPSGWLRMHCNFGRRGNGRLRCAIRLALKKSGSQRESLLINI